MPLSLYVLYTIALVLSFARERENNKFKKCQRNLQKRMKTGQCHRNDTRQLGRCLKSVVDDSQCQYSSDRQISIFCASQWTIRCIEMTYFGAEHKPFCFFLEYLPVMVRNAAHMSPETNFEGQMYVGTYDVETYTLWSLYPLKHWGGPVPSSRIQTDPSMAMSRR